MTTTNRLRAVALAVVAVLVVAPTSTARQQQQKPRPKIHTMPICFAPIESLTKYKIVGSSDTTWDRSKIPFVMFCQK